MSERHARPVGLLLRLINAEYLRLVDSKVKPYGLTASQSEAIYYIAQDEGLSQSKLKLQLGVSAASLSVLIDALAAKELVKRQNDASDPRRVMLYLTPASKQFALEVIKMKESIYRGLRETMSESQLALLGEWLEQFLANLENQSRHTS